MSKFKVLQWHLTDIPGGVSEYMLNNIKYIDKDKIETDFVFVGNHPNLYLDRIGSADNLKNVRNAAENRDAFFEDMNNLFRYGGYDAVHFNTSYWAGHELEKMAKDNNISRIIIHSHSTRVDIEDDEKRKKAEEKHEIKKAEFSTEYATNFCACSKLAADWLYGPQIPRDRIKILNNAINVEKFLFNKQIREKYRQEFGLGDSFVIGNVARMSHQKNHEFLLDVFANVCNRIDNAKLLLVGNGPLENDIRQKAERLGLLDKIVFAGFRDDVNNIMQAMDIFCLPSRFEGLGIVYIEALSAGLECLASDVVPREVNLCDNMHFLPFDVSAWSNLIIEISKGYERKNMYKIITEAGYNIEFQIKEVENIYLN
ncbi:MAG: glycosyltransferase [Oscillospiraceae bacterium]